MAPLYEKALIVGATSGIGEALAAKLLAEGTSVVVTGRRRERLDAFLAAHPPPLSPSPSAATAAAMPLDVTQLGALPTFAAAVAAAHPDLDCVVFNAGIQRAFDFGRGGVDLGAFGEELTTNYVAVVHLVTALLPHLRRVAGAAGKAHLVLVGASLGLVPTLVRTPGYNASKAALHSWATALRQQLRDAGARVRVVEVFPPAVQTELHDERHQPDLVGGAAIGMPLAAFTERLYAGLAAGADQFAVGPAEPWLADGGFEAERARLFATGQEALKVALAPYIRKEDVRNGEWGGGSQDGTE
ncbi:hypothetical protein GGS23DRAFT_515892 [Durotheca rogersii]|uniref:uncharacterized protein n=1 Tax=Durotheca rogersii TaxID=419775 RepID=UPI00221FA122|nr:uncharacterized protein GGS23DRAFT_515892 [Durotheca rogersii]KAI5863824.1 hypothetical protein GGS23DRAFT_515892 [Durotheca rogersii]